jgi:DNA polymerase-4
MGVSVSVRDNELFTKQWQCKIPLSTQSPSVIAREAFSLFEKNYSWKNPIRSITVRAINLVSLDYDEQIKLFYDAEKDSRIEALDKAVEEIRSRYGYNAIKNATLLQNPKMPSHNSTKLIMPTGIPQ